MAGAIICNNCSFIHNYAKNGGAVFNQGWIGLENCTFSNNDAYGKGDNVCIGEGGLTRVNGINLTGDYGPVYFATSYSLTDISLLSILCIGATVVISFFAGAASGGLLTSIALGFCIGAIFGITGVKIASDSVFDLNFDSTTYAAVLIGGSILAGVGAAVLGCTFFSQATCCDYWCINLMDSEPGFFYASSETASSLSEGSEIAEDLISVISGMTS